MWTVIPELDGIPCNSYWFLVDAIPEFRNGIRCMFRTDELAVMYVDCNSGIRRNSYWFLADVIPEFRTGIRCMFRTDELAVIHVDCNSGIRRNSL